jgi:hypothetical protein
MLCRLLPVGVVALVLAGCGPAKLDVSKTYSLNVETPAHSIDLDAQTKPQTINVEFSSSEGDVSVLVFKKSDVPTDDDLLIAEPKKAIAMKKGKTETFTVDIPENTPVRIIVRMELKKTDVQLKVTNKKA